MNWSVIIGIFGTLAGFALSYLAFARNSKKDSTDAGKESGTVLTEIGYIKANTDDIKRKQEKQDDSRRQLHGRDPVSLIGNAKRDCNKGKYRQCICHRAENTEHYTADLIADNTDHAEIA